MHDAPFRPLHAAASFRRIPIIAAPPKRAQLEDILCGIPTDDVAEVLGRALIDAHGAELATSIADKIGRIAHMAAREGR